MHQQDNEEIHILSEVQWSSRDGIFFKDIFKMSNPPPPHNTITPDTCEINTQNKMFGCNNPILSFHTLTKYSNNTRMFLKGLYWYKSFLYLYFGKYERGIYNNEEIKQIVEI